MNEPNRIRDLIYFDEGKAASIFSQFRGGLVQEMQAADEATTMSRASAGANVAVLAAESGNEATRRIAQLESRILHHAPLDELERDLEQSGLALDVTAAVADASAAPSLRDRLDCAATSGAKATRA